MNAFMNLLVCEQVVGVSACPGAMTQHLPDSSTDLCLCTVPLSGQKINAECEHLKHPIHCHRAHHEKQVTRTPIITVLSCLRASHKPLSRGSVLRHVNPFSKTCIGGLSVCSVGASSCEAAQSGALPLVM